MISSTQEQAIKAQYEALKPELDARGRRLWAATEARSLGDGGSATGVRATGLAASPVRLGKKALTRPAMATGAPRRVRRPGAGRTPLTAQDQTLLAALEALGEPTTRGDPMSPRRWTGKSTRRLAQELCRQGHQVSQRHVGPLLKALNSRVPGPRKTREGTAPPDRNAPCADRTRRVQDFQHRGQPVVSGETKKKALGGDFATGGRAYQPQGVPEPVRGHDLLDTPLGKALPSGGYDMTQNCAWVSVGVAHETAEFAVAPVPQWWQRMGCHMAPQAQP